MEIASLPLAMTGFRAVWYRGCNTDTTRKPTVAPGLRPWHHLNGFQRICHREEPKATKQSGVIARSRRRRGNLMESPPKVVRRDCFSAFGPPAMTGFDPSLSTPPSH